MNNVLNKFDKTFVVLIKKFLDVKNLISRYENSKILSISSILSE